MPLTNEICLARTILMDLVNLKRCGRSCATTDDLSDRISILSETKSVNLEVINTIKGLYLNH